VSYLFVIAGLVLLFFGGEWLLKGSVSLARRFGLSDLLVSAVIVGFGTSMPEMFVSVGAALKGSPDIALGNIVGSNIANVILIMALCMLIFPVTVKDKAPMRDALMVLFASFILCALSFTGTLMLWQGLLMLSLLVAYIWWSYQQDRKKTAAEKSENSEHVAHLEEDTGSDRPLPPLKAAAYCVVSLAVLVVGARLLVNGATDLARDFGVSEAVIGLTLVAVGTSLPELATGVVAALRKHGDVIIGNILGSNFFNILAILGVTATIAPIPMTGQIVAFDIWVMLAIAVLLIPMMRAGHTIARWQSMAMLTAYCAYVGWLYAGMGG
jgi:cation:H+ antiporter